MFGDDPEPASQATPEEPARADATGDDNPERNTAYQALVGTPSR